MARIYIALSGRAFSFFMLITQGVAIGLIYIAPSGRSVPDVFNYLRPERATYLSILLLIELNEYLEQLNRHLIFRLFSFPIGKNFVST